MVQAAQVGMTKVFELVLIKPSHYDDEGYVIQWLRSSIPSNTLARCTGSRSTAPRGGCWARTSSPHHRPGRDQHPHQARRDHPPDPRGGRTGAGRPRRRADQPVPARRGPRAAVPRRRHPGLHRRVPRQRLPGDAAGGAAGAPRRAWISGITLFAGEAEGRFDELLQAADRRELEAALQLHERPSGAGGRADAVPAGARS